MFFSGKSIQFRSLFPGLGWGTGPRCSAFVKCVKKELFSVFSGFGGFSFFGDGVGVGVGGVEEVNKPKIWDGSGS